MALIVEQLQLGGVVGEEHTVKDALAERRQRLEVAGRRRRRRRRGRGRRLFQVVEEDLPRLQARGVAVPVVLLERQTEEERQELRHREDGQVAALQPAQVVRHQQVDQLQKLVHEPGRKIVSFVNSDPSGPT